VTWADKNLNFFYFIPYFVDLVDFCGSIGKINGHKMGIRYKFFIFIFIVLKWLAII
jgi:hypothetical protein